MAKKIITYLLLFSFLNYIGCSSYQYITVKEYDLKLLEEDPPSKIYVTTNDLVTYHFTNSASYYYIKNDTLHLKGKGSEYVNARRGKVITGRMITIQGNNLTGDIKSVEEIGPNEITVITTSGRELHFENKRNYYIENDSLFGKGVIEKAYGEEPFEGAIVLSNIKSIHSGLIVKGENSKAVINFVKENKNEGVEVAVLLKSGTYKYGELLSVRDSTLILCRYFSASEEELANEIYPIISIKSQEIKKITVQGESYGGEGALYGALIGAAFGIVFGLLGGDDSSGWFRLDAEEKVICAGIVFSLLGAIIGGIAGSSTNDLIIHLPPEYDFSLLNSSLNQLSRYPDEEPEYLKTIK